MLFKRSRRRSIADNAPAIDPTVSNWVNQCLWNEGGVVSAASINAVNNFYLGMVAANLTQFMRYVMPMVPDSRPALLTPLIHTQGTSTIMGLSGNPTFGVNGITWASGSYGLVNFCPAQGFTSGTASMGMTLYGYTANNVASSYDFGTTDFAGSTMFAMKLRDTTTNVYIQDATNGKVTISFPGNGFFSGNRTALNDLRLYWGNSTNPLAQMGSTTTTGTSQSLLASVNMYLLGATSINGSSVFGNNTGNTHSFFAIHTGLTAAQVGSLFTLVQALRTALGGGVR